MLARTSWICIVFSELNDRPKDIIYLLSHVGCSGRIILLSEASGRHLGSFRRLSGSSLGSSLGAGAAMGASRASWTENAPNSLCFTAETTTIQFRTPRVQNWLFDEISRWFCMVLHGEAQKTQLWDQKTKKLSKNTKKKIWKQFPLLRPFKGPCTLP